jgi:hypothetical protein
MFSLRCSSQQSPSRIQTVFDGVAVRALEKLFLCPPQRVGPSEASPHSGRQQEVSGHARLPSRRTPVLDLLCERKLAHFRPDLGLPADDKMCKSQANTHADNGFSGLSMPSQLGLRSSRPGRLSCLGQGFPITGVCQRSFIRSGFLGSGANRPGFSSVASSELPSHGFGS